MNTRHVLLIIFGTVLLSVASTLITLRLTQNKTEKITATHSVETPPPSQVIQLVKDAPAPPPPPRPSQEPPKAFTPSKELIAEMAALQKPKEFESKNESRSFLKPQEVKDTLLKRVPSCHSDYDEFCTKNYYMSEHPLACLRSKKGQLSSSCERDVKAIQAEFHQACGKDIERFCSQERVYFMCLKQRLPDLTPECRKNIKDSSRS